MNATTRSVNKGSSTYVLGICLVATLGGLLFGYDTAVISGAIGFLQQRFELGPAETGWAASSALVGCILGVAVAGVLNDFLGRKKALTLCGILFLASALGTALPENLTEFVIFRILGGIGVGAASMTSPMYIAEISPAPIRGRLVSINQFAIIFGMLVVYFVNYFIALQGDTAWNIDQGWRWMFGSEAIPALLLLVLLGYVPDSPRWLCKQNRAEEAERVLRRIGGPQHAEQELRLIQNTLAQERGDLKELLRPGLRTLLIIGIILAVLQQVTGINVFLYYAPEIFKKLGAGTNVALLQTVVVGAVNLIFTIFAIWTVDRLGRKPLLMIGATGMGLSLVCLGLASYFQQVGGWAIIFVLGYIACFAMSMGPVVWVVLSEIFPTKLRGRALSIATFFLWVANYIVSQTFPMMNENAWLVATFHRAFPFWIYGSLCFVTVAFVAGWIPETKGKSLEEIERLWLR